MLYFVFSFSTYLFLFQSFIELLLESVLIMFCKCILVMFAVLLVKNESRILPSVYCVLD